MKTAGVGSILSFMCVGFASACSSQVSIGHNDRAVTADSGTPGSGGQGEAWVNMGRGMTAVAGGVGTGGGAGVTGQAGSGPIGPPPNIGASAAFEAEPGTVVEIDGGSGACAPVDTAGSLQVGGGWTSSIPGNVGNLGCGRQAVETAVDIKAAYSQNTAGVVRTFTVVRPPFSQDPPVAPLDCTTVPPDTMFFTAGVPEQLVIFDVPRHIDVNQTVLSAIDVDNSVGQAMTGSSQHYLLTSAPAGGLGCGPAKGLNGGLAGVQAKWELNPGEEMMICVRYTLKFDHDARWVRIESPAGTYRSVFSVGNPTGQDGASLCGESADGDHVLGYGVDGGTVEARLWDGHIAAGQQMVLRMDARNATNDWQTGTVSVELN